MEKNKSVIPKECKRLAEVDFPIAVVSKHSAREKSIRHGHPSTLHLWWARRPLAACRAMLLGLLLPDPCDEHCPKDFKEKARSLLPSVQGKVGSKDEDLRKSLLKFIGDFANWDLSTDRTYLEVSRGLVKAAHPEETPLVVDPFAGGGSIPLEALRLGCEAFASDLNPVACLILKVMLEDIPRHGPQLAEELQKVGKKIKEETEKELAEFYPLDSDGSRPIAYLWARTVKCETPNCGAEIPLIRSFWLSKTTGRKYAMRYQIIRKNGKSPEVKFEIFIPKNDKEVQGGTMHRARATCLCCNIVLHPERVRAQLRDQKGGADVIFDQNGKRIGGARIMAVVTAKSGKSGRFYRLPEQRDYEAVWKAEQRQSLNNRSKKTIPDEQLSRVPVTFGVINVWVYGMNTWGDIFSARQKIALSTLFSLVRNIKEDSIKALLAVSLGKLIDFNSSLARWAPARETSAATFGRQAIPMMWDFCETIPVSDSTGSISVAIEFAVNVINNVGRSCAHCGQIEQANACDFPLPDHTASVWFTDLPYYDNVPYSYISDFFYIWHKRTLGLVYPKLFESSLTPKKNEVVAYIGEDGDVTTARQRFESLITKAFSEGKRVLKPDQIGSVVFAHKTTEGWEALLTALIQGGWVITGSWPISTERSVRPRAHEAAALNTSVHLVCRPRPEDAPVGDWGDVLRELPNRVGDWMERLQKEHIRGADLVFACIGPALEIFSKYSKVVDPQEREIPLGGNPEASEPYKRGFLTYVWEVIGRSALEQVLGTARNGVVGTIEEDARLTALFLWTLQSTNGKDTPSP